MALNKIDVMGRIVRDPEIRQTQSGIKTANLTIAVDRDFKGANGEKQTDFIPVMAWRQTAEFIGKYFKKGDPILVSGRLQISNWERDGQKHSRAEVVADNVYFCGGKRDSSNSNVGIDVGAPTFTDFSDDDGVLPWDDADELPL